MERSPVSSDKHVLGGCLVFKGTRVPVQSLIDYLDDGYTVEEFIEFFPSVKKEDADAFLRLIQPGDERPIVGRFCNG